IANQIDPAAFVERNIGNHEVRFESLHSAEGITGSFRFPTNFEVRLFGDQFSDSIANNGVIVHEQNPLFGWSHITVYSGVSSTADWFLRTTLVKGTVQTTTVPPWGKVRKSSEPPISCAR